MYYFKFKPFEFEISSQVLAIQHEKLKIDENVAKT
jgi:hypothetical protein